MITNKSKCINLDQNFEPGKNFVELADGSRTSKRVLKSGYACIISCNNKGHMCRYILKIASYIPTFEHN